MSSPPLSKATQFAVAVSLVMGSALSAGPQYAEHVWAGSLSRVEQIRWGLEHPLFYRAEWLAGMVGSLLLLIGFLGLCQVARWSTRRLTAAGAVVLTWGMSGQIFSETATYSAQVVAAHVLGPADAERLIARGYLHDPGIIVGVLVPVVAGMFFGVILLALALWRSAFPRVPVVLLAMWPLWDMLGPTSSGPLAPELFLAHIRNLAGGRPRPTTP